MVLWTSKVKRTLRKEHEQAGALPPPQEKVARDHKEITHFITERQKK